MTHHTFIHFAEFVGAVNHAAFLHRLLKYPAALSEFHAMSLQNVIAVDVTVTYVCRTRCVMIRIRCFK